MVSRADRLPFSAGDHLAVYPADFKDKGTITFPGLLPDQRLGPWGADFFVAGADKGQWQVVQKTTGSQGLEGKNTCHQPAFHVDHARAVGPGYRLRGSR